MTSTGPLARPSPPFLDSLALLVGHLVVLDGWQATISSVFRCPRDVEFHVFMFFSASLPSFDASLLWSPELLSYGNSIFSTDKSLISCAWSGSRSRESCGMAVSLAATSQWTRRQREELFCRCSLPALETGMASELNGAQRELGANEQTS